MHDATASPTTTPAHHDALQSREPEGGWHVLTYAHTHWDREWYQPFERFRIQLVGAIDRILATLDRDPGYTYTLDGQTIVIDDYLAIRPECLDDIRRHIAAGRLEIGPWFILPDEFLVSGESLIRNLLQGRRDMRRFGASLDLGYLPDPFGHVAQMPQILRGFGIDAAMFSRGMGDEWDTLGTEFLWRAPDGTDVLGIVQTGIGINGYCNGEVLSQVHDPASSVPVDTGVALLNQLISHARTNILVIAAGCDHETVNPLLPGILDHIATTTAIDGVDVRLAGLGQIASAYHTWRERHGDDILGSLTGELRGSRHAPILSSILSARITLKQQNVKLQTLLERTVEPIVALTRLRGGTAEHEALLHHAWRLALSNQPHDSIGGCSVDAVHDQMPARSAQAMDTCQGVLEEQMSLLSVADQAIVFNPHPFIASGVVTANSRSCWVSGLAPLSLTPLIEATAQHPRSTVSVESDRSIRSEGIRVSASQDGCVMVELLDGDRVDVTLSDALSFVDVGDAGDEYDFSPVAGDRALTARLTSATASLASHNIAQLVLHHEIDIPAGIIAGQRAAVTVPHAIETTLTLAGDREWIECETTMVNASSDHRVRVRTVLDQVVTASIADSPFTVVERPVTPYAPKHDWAQDPPTSHPCESFAAIDGSGYGVALLTEALHEYEVRHARGRSELEVTLLRCVGWLSRDDIVGRPGHAGPALETPGAQCPGPHRVRYAILPYRGAWHEARVPDIARRFMAPPTVIGPVHEEIRVAPGNRARVRDLATSAAADAPRSIASFNEHGLRVDGALISSLKPADDGSGDTILRVYNPYPTEAAATIALPKNAHATLVQLDESAPVDAAERWTDSAQLTLPPSRIITLRITRRSS